MKPFARQIISRIDELKDQLITISHEIHLNPELAFQERFACSTLTNAAKSHGIEMDTGVYDLATAFEGTVQGKSAGPNVAIIAEYDALPKLGHACGHNLIAASALGAVLGLAAVKKSLPGTIKFLGTPAEEKGGGKELMARRGAFDNLDAAMMIHPAGVNLSTMPSICMAEVHVEYHGRSAHAAAMPHKGKNALDGLLLAYQSISNLRQHLRDHERVHGIITDGGQAPNIVPDYASGEFYVRTANIKDLTHLKPRVEECFRAGAVGSGCEFNVKWANVDYLDLNTNWPLANTFKKYGESLGRSFLSPKSLGGAGSTDMGNVSHRVPAIHPMLSCAPQNVVIHSPEFTKWAKSPSGDEAALDGAKALALTAAEFLTNKDLQKDTKKAFLISKGLA